MIDEDSSTLSLIDWHDGYDLSPTLIAAADAAAAEVRGTMAKAVRQIGSILRQQKEALPHGAFGRWHEQSLGMSQQQVSDTIAAAACLEAINSPELERAVRSKRVLVRLGRMTEPQQQQALALVAERGRLVEPDLDRIIAKTSRPKRRDRPTQLAYEAVLEAQDVIGMGFACWYLCEIEGHDCEELMPGWRAIAHLPAEPWQTLAWHIDTCVEKREIVVAKANLALSMIDRDDLRLPDPGVSPHDHAATVDATAVAIRALDPEGFLNGYITSGAMASRTPVHYYEEMAWGVHAADYSPDGEPILVPAD